MLDSSHPILSTLLERTARILRSRGVGAEGPMHARADDIVHVDVIDDTGEPDGTVRGRDTETSFTADTFEHAYGKRDYKLFVPNRANGTDRTHARDRALVVMLHGCTQHPDDFAAGTRMNEAAQAHGFLVLYPAQSTTANPQRCWNWFKHNHQSKGRGEPALLADMTRRIAEKHGVDPQRIAVAGMSAGGAMAAILGREYPDVFSAVGVHSGLAPGAANDLPSALAAMKSGPVSEVGPRLDVPTIIIHGDRDTTVHPANAAHFLKSETNVIFDENPDARGASSFTRSVARDASGRVHKELWMIKGAGHAWSGGSAAGSCTYPAGPSATDAMVDFFQKQTAQREHE